MATPSTCSSARATPVGELSLFVAKGTFLEGAAQNVGMHMEHGLTGVLAGVEDEAELASLIEYNLNRHGYDAQVLGGSQGTLKALEFSKPDLILLDVMLPDVDGFELCRQIRQSTVLARTPVLFLTARSDEVDRVLGLEIGGDDYMTKPFGLAELAARVQTVLRRTRPAGATGPVLTFADVELDQDSYEVRRGGRLIELSPTEFRLLRYLMLNPGRVLTRAQLLDHVWDYDFGGSSTVVATYVAYLRRKLAQHGSEVIHTQRGVGYVLRRPRPSDPEATDED